MLANFPKSRNNANPEILGLHLFWVRDIQSIALLFSDFLSYLFLPFCIHLFTNLCVLLYVCLCSTPLYMWNTEQNLSEFFLSSLYVWARGWTQFQPWQQVSLSTGPPYWPMSLFFWRKQQATVKKGCWVPISLSCLRQHVWFPLCSTEIKRSRIAHWTTDKPPPR